MLSSDDITTPLRCGYHDHTFLQEPYLWKFIHDGTMRYKKNCTCGRYNKGCVMSLVGQTDDEVVEGAEAAGP
jgi:hypothetical protein